MLKVASVMSRYAGKRIAVGVSGGRDSVCLLHAVLNCGAVDKADILVVHVNHCLRDSADSDELFVKEFCARNGLAFRAFRVDVYGECAKNGRTVEQAARDLRYGVFGALIGSGDVDAVLTAHPALDNAESVLMHLFRGAGLDGLCGMSAVDDERKLARPLINVFPREIDEYVKLNGLSYVTDETNFCDDADRNFIRLNVIPLIEKRYLGAVRAVNELAGECRDVCARLDAELDMSRIARDGDAVTIADDALDGALASRYVRRALVEFSLVDVTREQLHRAAALAHMRTGATVDMNNGVKATREYGRIALYIPRPECDTAVPLKTGANFLDGLAVDVARSDALPKNVARGCAVDLAALDGAVLRFRRDGDMFCPFGGKRKKLKQYFIDKKIEKRKRDRIPLICKGGEVLVVVGVEVSDGAKQTDKTVDKAVVTPRWRTV